MSDATAAGGAAILHPVLLEVAFSVYVLLRLFHLKTSIAPLTDEIICPTRHHFFKCSVVSANRLLDDCVADRGGPAEFADKLLRDVVNVLVARHALTAPVVIDVAMACPVAHVLL